MELAWNIAYYAFVALYVYTAIVVLTVILLENRNPVKTLGWIMIMVLLPIFGIVLYVFFGQDFRRKKIMANKMKLPAVVCKDAVDIVDVDDSVIPWRFHKLANLLSENCNAVLSPNNQIDVFTTGKDTFDALFNDIAKAEDNIHIEFYIIENDRVGEKLFKLLVRKAKAGVRVRVIYDYLGGWKLPIMWRKALKDAGGYIQPYMAANSVWGFTMLNYRNHRKLVIVDGKVAYTGGVNIADRYRTGNNLGFWRDTFIRIQGPAVHSMQFNFLQDWNFVDGKAITDLKYYPEPRLFDNDNFIQIVTSGPDTDWANIMQGVVSAIVNAQKEIFIHTPYYMPPEGVMTALETAALSGIDVRVMIPERNDSVVVAAAGRSYIEAMLKAGIRVYFYQHNFLHSKAIVVDRCLSIVGTANMDNRSYEQNFEIAAFVYDKATASKLVENFGNDIESCRELNINLWRHRKRRKKMVESVARLFSPLL